MRKYLLLSLLISVTFSLWGQEKKSIGGDGGPGARLKYLLRNLEKADTANAEMIPVNFNLINDVENALPGFKGISQHDSLAGLIPDFTVFQKDLQRLDSAYTLYSPVVRRQMAHIEHELYDESALSLMAMDTARSVALLERALQYKPAYHPAWYELIRISLTPARSVPAMAYYDAAMKRLDPQTDQYYRNLYLETGPKVIDACIRMADQLTSAENYLAAVDYLEKVNIFARQYNIPGGVEKVARARANAHQGMYNSYLHIADRAKQARKWQLAADYYKKAADYQQRFPNDIPMTVAFDPGLPQLTNQPDSIRKPLAKKTYSKKHKRSYKKKSKARRIKTERAERDKSIRQPKAVESQKPATLAVDSGLIMAQARARESILRASYDAYFIVWKNQLDTARKILMLNQSLQAMHGLQADSGVNAALNELKDRIRDKECFNSQSDYETNIQRALNYCKRRDFIAAEYPLQRAADLVSQKKSCQWNDSLYHYVVLTYQPAIAWSKKKSAWESAYLKKEYADFVVLYEESYEIFKTSNLEKLGIQQLSLVPFLLQKEDPALLVNIGLQLAEHGRHEKGLAMFTALKDSGKPRTFAKDAQQKLGLILSVSYPDKKAKPEWLSRFLEDPWFKFMANSYFRGGKRFSLPLLNR